MSDDFYIDATEVEKLGDAFSTHAYDLASCIRAFRGKTDGETIHDGFGFLTESEEVTSSYIELSNEIADSLDKLTRHFDEMARALTGNAKNTEAADQALEDMFKGGAGAGG